MFSTYECIFAEKKIIFVGYRMLKWALSDSYRIRFDTIDVGLDFNTCRWLENMKSK